MTCSHILAGPGQHNCGLGCQNLSFVVVDVKGAVGLLWSRMLAFAEH